MNPGHSFNSVFKAKILSLVQKSSEYVEGETGESSKILCTYNLKIRLWYFDLTTAGEAIGNESAGVVTLADALTIKSKDVTTTYTYAVEPNQN